MSLMKNQRQWKTKANKVPYSVNTWVTNCGRVFSSNHGFLIEMIPSKSANGYLRVQVLKNGIRKWVAVHRLVLDSWLYEAPDKFCNHKNGDKTDNRIENLEWVTAKENSQHAVKVLEKMTGVKNPSSKITEADVRFIRGSNLDALQLGKMFNITRESIYNINNRTTWKHVT